MTVRTYLLPGRCPRRWTCVDRHGPTLLVMAGGTVAMPLINEGISLPEAVMGLRRAGLDGIERGRRLAAHRRDDDADASWREQDDVPMLARGGPQHGQLGDPQHGHRRRQPVHAAARRRRRGRPARPRRDRDAGERARASGSCRWPTSSPGFMTTGLAADELLVAIDVPGPARRRPRSSSSAASTPTRRPS